MAVNKQGKIELMNAAGEVTYADPKNKVLLDAMKNFGFLPANLMRQEKVIQEAAAVEQSADPVVSPRVPASADGVTSDARRPLGGYIHAPEQTYKNRIETSAPLSARVPDAIRPASIYEPQREITEADMNPYVQKASYASKGADTYEGIDGTTKQTPVNTDTVVVNPSFSGGQTATPGQVAQPPVVEKQVVAPFRAKQEFNIPSNVEVAQQGNQFGYHRKPAGPDNGKQTFLTVNENDPYWDTHKKGTGDAWSNADLKAKPNKEVDTKAIKDWLGSIFN